MNLADCHASERAVEAASLLRRGGATATTRQILAAAHDPALGLDRSVCLRDVVEAMRGEDHFGGEYVDADWIAAKFGGGA